jgi:hypothetical protein
LGPRPTASVGGRGRGSDRSVGARRRCVRRRDDPSPKRGGVSFRTRTDGIELAPPMRCLLKTRSCARALSGIGAARNGVGLEKNYPAGGKRVPRNKSGGYRRTGSGWEVRSIQVCSGPLRPGTLPSGLVSPLRPGRQGRGQRRIVAGLGQGRGQQRIVAGL